MSTIQTLTEFQSDLLYQLWIGPAPSVVLQSNEELTSLVATGLVESLEIPKVNNIKVVSLTDAGFAFCRDSGSTSVN